MPSKFFNLDTDTTLGGSNASDNYVSSQKAVKNYVDTLSEDLQTTINSKANSATTLSGYGITNAYTKTEVDSLIKDNTTTITFRVWS